jgi:hypothetical protein
LSTDQLVGLHVIMADDCAGLLSDGACLSREATIGDERELWCATCGAYRKKLAGRAAAFLTEIISKFGRPDNPITLRKAVGFIRSPDLWLHQNSSPTHLKRRYRKMDMRQYGQTYLQPEDLQKTGGTPRNNRRGSATGKGCQIPEANSGSFRRHAGAAQSKQRRQADGGIRFRQYRMDRPIRSPHRATRSYRQQRN